jgi:metal-responsive CopG/Arc/MetJ family transcriptional regulator
MAYVKTAISLPEDMFAAISARASETRQSRSALIAEAIAGYLRNLQDEEFTRQMNEAVASVSDEEWENELKWTRSSARRALDRLTELDGGWRAP